MINRKIYFNTFILIWITCLYLLIIQWISYFSCSNLAHTLNYESCIVWKSIKLDKFDILNILFLISLFYIVISICFFIYDFFKFLYDFIFSKVKK